MGREFPLDVLAAALGETTERVQIEMDRCCARGIVEVVPDMPGRFRFVHLLVRDTFYEHSNASNRAHTHLAVATAMEAARHAQHGDHAAELAHHYFEAAHIGGAKKAVTYAVQAADEARARLALESVPALYRKAMTAADYCADLDEAARCRMLIELGKAEMNASERENGRESLIQAARLAKRIGDVELVARAALSLAPGALALEVGIYDPTLVGLLEEALEAGGALPKALRSHLLARLSLALTWADRESDQRATAEEALALARAATTPGPLAMALIAQYAVLGGPENLDTRTALAHELSVAAGRTGISDLVLMHRLLHVTNLLESRQMARLDAEIDRFRSEAEASQLPHFLWYAGLFRAMRLLVAGEFSEAAEAAENFLAVGSRISDQNAVLSFATHCVYHLWETGQSAKAGELGAAFASRFASVAAWPAAAAVFEHDGGDVESARAKIYRQLAQFPTVPHNQVWTTAAAFLTEGCFRVGAADYARKLYKAMAPGVGQIAVVGFGVASAGPISRHLGLLAATFGELDTALRHFSDAIREEIEIGGVPWLAKSKLDMARTLMMRGRRDDIDRSRSLAGEVASITAGNGMKTLNEQARSVAHDANSRR
jgi:tetratricopeptide (TPR) repeat protein